MVAFLGFDYILKILNMLFSVSESVVSLRIDIAMAELQIFVFLQECCVLVLDPHQFRVE
jgi:hypothetical protein